MMNFSDQAKVLVVTAALFMSGSSFACRCVEPGPPAGNYKRAAAVFVGTVVSVQEGAEQRVTATFRVSKAWKKHLGAEVDVSTEAGTCAATMTPGVTYLLYARELPAHAGLTTERCMGNLPIDGAEKPLDWLKRNAKPTVITAPR